MKEILIAENCLKNKNICIEAAQLFGETDLRMAKFQCRCRDDIFIQTFWFRTNA